MWYVCPLVAVCMLFHLQGRVCVMCGLYCERLFLSLFCRVLVHVTGGAGGVC